MTEFSELGILRPLGTITPNTLGWQRFPGIANQGNTILIAQYSGQMDFIRSYIYLREIYETSPKIVSRNWIKLNPKPEIEIINSFFNPELQNLRIQRSFEVTKWFRYRLTGSKIDDDYSISLSELFIFPQYINQNRETLLSQATINALTDAILQGLQGSNDNPNFFFPP